MNSTIFDKIREPGGFRLDGLLLALTIVGLGGDVSFSLFVSWAVGLWNTGAPSSYSHTRLREGKYGGSNGAWSLTQNPVHWRSSAIKGLHSSQNIGLNLSRANHSPINKFRVCASEVFQIAARRSSTDGSAPIQSSQSAPCSSRAKASSCRRSHASSRISAAPALRYVSAEA